ncbi:MAG: hypothetical protein AUH33_03100 [Chloroflexi bacterium 13_1_40CM_68_21]|nr:MAG: hypothetical protein AUH33_03100 [Chloroflexi bacterium 13_1_40CM_68_21]
MRHVLHLLLIGLAMAACHSVPVGSQPSPTTVRVASPLPVGSVDGMAPRPTHPAGSLPAPWTEAIAAKIHADLTAPFSGALPSVPAPISSRFIPFRPPDAGLQCPRYDVAFGTDDPATLVGAFRFLLVSRSYDVYFKGDVGFRLDQEARYGSPSYFGVELGAWAPGRAYQVTADLGDPSLAKSAGFDWAEAGVARYLVVLRYEQRCALL